MNIHTKTKLIEKNCCWYTVIFRSINNNKIKRSKDTAINALLILLNNANNFFKYNLNLILISRLFLYVKLLIFIYKN